MDVIRFMQTIKEKHDYSTYDHVRAIILQIDLWKRLNDLAIRIHFNETTEYTILLFDTVIISTTTVPVRRIRPRKDNMCYDKIRFHSRKRANKKGVLKTEKLKIVIHPGNFSDDTPVGGMH